MSNTANSTPNTERPTVSHKHLLIIMTGIYMGSMYPTFLSIARAYVLTGVLVQFNAMQFYAIVSIIATLSMSVIMPIGGKLGDIYGRKKLYLISLVIFLLSCFGCAFAFNVVMYGVSIMFAGISQGLINTLYNAIIADITTAEERPKYVGYASTSSSIVQMVSALLTGIIMDHFGWSWVFAFGVPIPLISFIIIMKYLPNIQTSSSVKPKIDFVGIIAFIAAIAPLLVLLSLGGTIIPWGSPICISILVVVVFAAVMLVYTENRHEAPIIPFFLFKNSAFAKVFFIAFFCQIAATSVLIYLPYYIQNIMGLSVTASGTITTPRAILAIVLATSVGIFLSKTGKYKLILTSMLSIAAISYVLMCFLTPESSTAFCMFVALVNGFGANALLVVLITLAQRSLPRENLGAGTSLIVFTASFGGALGNSIAGLFTNGAWKNIEIPQQLLAVLTQEQITAMSKISILKDTATLNTIRESLSVDLVTVLDETILSFRYVLGNGVRNQFILFVIVTIISLLITLTYKDTAPKKMEKP